MGSLRTLSSIHMNCTWEISFFPQPNFSERETENIVKEAFQKVDSFENYFTVFKDSPFNDINKFAGIRPVEVSQDAISLINKSIEYYLETKNFFNICFQSSPGFNNPTDIIIDEVNSTIFLPTKEMKVSLGGIGKGYSVDMCFEYLKRKGLVNFMVNGSGDLRVHSHPSAPRAWKVGITNPFNIENKIGFINIKDGSLATSGQYRSKNHIKTNSKNTPLATTVRSITTTHADVFATYMSSLSVEDAVLKMEDLNINGFIIDRKGKIYRSTRSFKEI